MAEQVKVVTRRLGVDNTWDINTYMQHDGYRALETALKETQPDEIIELIKNKIDENNIDEAWQLILYLGTL